MRVIRTNGFYFCAVQPVWILACVAVLVRTLLLRTYDAQELELFLMLALSWPICFAALGIYLYYLYVFNSVPTLTMASLFSMWALFFVAGWLQWFVVLPPIVTKVRSALSTQVSTVSCVPKASEPAEHSDR